MATQTPPTPPPTRARPKMTVYGGGRPPKKRKRRWVRVALWTLGSFLVVLLAPPELQNPPDSAAKHAAEVVGAPGSLP